MLNEKLKILFISSWYPNKLKPLNGIFIKRHAEANTIDCDVSAIFICSADSYSIEESVEEGIYTIRGYYPSPKLKLFPFYGFLKLFRYLSLWKKVLSIYKSKQGKPDLINSNIVYPVTIIATCLKFLWKVPYVITEHWTGYFPEDGRYNGFMKKIITRIAVANAGAVITDSAKLGRTMTSLGLKNSYFTIPNVVDPEVFTTKSTGEKNNENFNFIHISSLDDAQKNVTGIIRTFKKFHVSNPLSKLTIIGNEHKIEFLEKAGTDDSGIYMIGQKTGYELAHLLREADAFILFSNYENLPCVMLESFMCGVPVIGTKVGDVPDFINAKNGVLIDSGNEGQLLRAMEAVYKNNENFNATEIRNMVLDKVSPAAISKQFMDIYKTVVSRRLPI